MEILFQTGTHICHFYRSFAEQKAVALPFIRHGLRAGAHCMFSVCEHSPDEWYLELQAYGVDVQMEREKGALLIVSEPETRPLGEFNAIRQSGDLWQSLQPLFLEFYGVRLAREVPWKPDFALPVNQLCQMEATGSLLFEETPVIALCQYDLNRHPPTAIHTALKTHAVVILDGRVIRNPFYDVPRILASEPDLYKSHADSAMVDEMLAKLRNGV